MQARAGNTLQSIFYLLFSGKFGLFLRNRQLPAWMLIVMLFQLQTTVYAQNLPSVRQASQKIEGHVIDTQNEPLIGAIVTLKGTTQAVVTDKDGKFVFPVPAGEQILVISYVGMKPQEIKASGLQPVQVIMDVDVHVLADVVITGIFSKERESYTGAVTTITAPELKMSGNRSLLATIRNIDPSFNIRDDIELGSDPNRLPDVTMRGRTSLSSSVRDLQEDSRTQSSSNTPLFVIDGFEVSLQKIIDLDDNQIESVTLLKDASATALYGARGSNGIVVITTRRPEAGSLRITYRGYLNIEAPDFTSYNLMNAAEKLQYEEAAGLYSNQNPAWNQEYREWYNERLIDVVRGVNTYWLKYPVQTGIGHRHSLRADGGDHQFKYSASLGYNNIAGVMKGSSRNTITGNFFFQYELKDVKIQNDLTVNFNKSSDSPYGYFGDYTVLNPYETPYNEDGSIKKMLVDKQLPEGSTLSIGNPLYNALLPTKNTSEYMEIRDNLAIEWKITPDFSARGRIGFIRQNARSDYYLSAKHTSFEAFTEDDYNRRGRYTYGTDYLFSYEGDFTFSYNKTFDDIHQLYAGLNYNLAEEKTENYTVTAEGFSAINMDNIGMANMYEQGSRPSGSESLSRRLGGVVNVNYTYNRRYFADFSGRLEGSSKFGSNDRTAPFWSAGLGWNVHHERFLQNNSIVDNLRLRLSYGTSGSQNFNPYQALMTFRYYSSSNYRYWNGSYLMGLENSDLGWQKTHQFNVGTETSFFNNRVRINVDLYNKLTSDLLSDINLPTSSGFNSYKANVGEVLNRGLELNANVFIIRDRASGVTWTVGGNLLHNQNKILKISNSLEFLNSELLAASASNPSFLFKEGESINTIFVVRSLGIDPANGQEVFLDINGNKTYEWNPTDKVACGVNEPKMWGNLRTMFRYKGISLNLVFGYRTGASIYNQTLLNKVENNDPWVNGDRRALYDRWKEPGDISFFKSIKNTSATRASSRFVMKENTLECRTLNLNYEFNREWLKKHFPAEYVAIDLYAEDLFRVSTIRQERGLAYPFARKYSLSLTVRF
jgi:TonB-linked SusC/RagA family outer membrane protein